jgi:hypothetical protein
MVQTRCPNRSRARSAFFVGVLFTVAFTITARASDTVGHAKSGYRAKDTAPGAKAASPAMNKAAGVRPFAGLHRDLLNLEEAHKGLQRQLEILTGATRRRAAELEQQTDKLTAELNRFAAAQQQDTVAQQLLTATLKSMRLLLMIIVALLLVLSGAVIFLVRQVKRSGGSELNEHRQIDATTGQAANEAFEPQWKVNS